MKRPDWTSRLYEFVYDPTNAVFVWGKNDCIMFGANCVRHITDEDPLSTVLDVWTTRDEAQQVLEQMGGMYEAVCSVLGPPIENPAMYQRGDLVLVELPIGDMLMVHLGDRLVGPTEESGLISVKVGHSKCVWAIGRHYASGDS